MKQIGALGERLGGDPFTSALELVVLQIARSVRDAFQLLGRDHDTCPLP
jgi:hypothetical protein